MTAVSEHTRIVELDGRFLFPKERKLLDELPDAIELRRHLDGEERQKFITAMAAQAVNTVVYTHDVDLQISVADRFVSLVENHYAEDSAEERQQVIEHALDQLRLIGDERIVIPAFLEDESKQQHIDLLTARVAELEAEKELHSQFTKIGSKTIGIFKKFFEPRSVHI